MLLPICLFVARELRLREVLLQRSLIMSPCFLCGFTYIVIISHWKYKLSLFLLSLLNLLEINVEHFCGIYQTRPAFLVWFFERFSFNLQKHFVHLYFCNANLVDDSSTLVLLQLTKEIYQPRRHRTFRTSSERLMYVRSICVLCQRGMVIAQTVFTNNAAGSMSIPGVSRATAFSISKDFNKV